MKRIFDLVSYKCSEAVTKSYSTSFSLATNQFKTDYNDRDDAPDDKILGRTHYRDESYIMRSQLQRFFDGGANLIIGTEISVSLKELRSIFQMPIIYLILKF